MTEKRVKNLPSLRIRPLEEADRPAWEVLWNGYLIFYRVELTAKVTETTWRRLLDHDRDMYGLGALNAAGELVGFVHYLFHPVTWSITDRCYLEDLYVSEQERGTGVGRALIEAVYAAGDARGADQVYWLTQESNAAARRLYDRVGQLTPFVKYRR